MPPAAAPKPGAPYCVNCHYDLTGATNTPVCPECGKPLVEVLVRGRHATTGRARRYRSETLLFGLPIIDVAIGPDPDGGEAFGRARGVIAIGDRATGGIAIGNQWALGVVAAGGGAGIGVVGIGGGAGVGLLAFGGGAGVGGFAVGGGAAAGGIATAGGAAVGVVAQASVAVGSRARGAKAVGAHTVSLQPPGASSPQAQAFFDRAYWLIGNPTNVYTCIFPVAHVGGAAVLLSAIIGALVVLAHRRANRPHA